MKTLLPNVLLFKYFRNGMTNSYAMMGLGYVLSIFLILFTFFASRLLNLLMFLLSLFNLIIREYPPLEAVVNRKKFNNSLSLV